MALQMTDLINELRIHLGVDNLDLPDADASLLLNRSYWDLIDEFKFREKEVIADFQVTQGQAFIAIPVPFEAIQQISIEDVNTFARMTLDRMTPWEYENIFVNNPDTSDFDKPTKYAREANGIRLWKTPDQTYNMVIRYWTVLQDLSSQNNNAPPLPQVWGEIILMGGVKRGFVRLGDYARAKAAQSEQDDMVQRRVLVRAKEAEDTHRGGLDVIGYDDVYGNVTTGRDVSRGITWPWLW